MTAALDRVALMAFSDYDPALVVETVDALLGLGAEPALDAVEGAAAHAGSTTIPYGLYWVLRVAFEFPDGRWPEVRLGTPTIPPPPQRSKLPRFPIALVDDVPLLVITGYTLAGKAQPIGAHIAEYRERASLRAARLSPPPGAAGVLERFLELWHDAYGGAFEAQVRKTVARQLG